MNWPRSSPSRTAVARQGTGWNPIPGMGFGEVHRYTGRMLTITETAASKVKELLAEEGRDDIALRVAVSPGGCSGLRYAMYLTISPRTRTPWKSSTASGS